MRKTIIILLFSLFYVFANAQSQKVKVTMKDGTTITGEMKQIDPTKSLTLVVAGIESEISMSDVSSIDPVDEGQKQTVAQTTSYTDEWIPEDFKKFLPSDRYGEYVILDKAEYPDSFTVVVGGQTFTMLLVRGGVFNMGYDGPESRGLRSEPVHKVKLSSFYVSTERFDEEVACNMLGLESKEEKDNMFETKNWDEAKQLVDKVAEQEGLPYRLLTDAEWEYAAVTPYAENIFKKNTRIKGNKAEWLNDFWGEYRESPQTDPTGPVSGKRHIARYYKIKYKRYPNTYNTVRLAISADQIIDKIK